MPLRCQIFRDGKHVDDKVFDQDIVKIGRLDSSHLRFTDGVARMHAVLERSGPGRWRLIDLGSSVGSQLDGNFVDKAAELGSKGVLEFGPWAVKYELVDEPHVSRDSEPDAGRALSDLLNASRRATRGDAHHKVLMEGLIAALEKTGSSAVTDARKMLARWEFMSMERRRKAMRLCVAAIRENRASNERVGRRMVASMLRMGPEGIAEIYELDPADALVQARSLILSISQAKAALKMLGEMDLADTIKKGAGDDADDEKRQSVREFLDGHEALEELLQEEMVQGISVLGACISRAGGHTLTHRERVELRKAFEQVQKAAQEEQASEASSE